MVLESLGRFTRAALGDKLLGYLPEDAGAGKIDNAYLSGAVSMLSPSARKHFDARLVGIHAETMRVSRMFRQIYPEASNF